MILISTLTVLMFFGGSHPPTDISFFQAEDGIRCFHVTGVQTCALPISARLIAGVTAKVLRDGPTASGLWHLTAAGGTSWHGFAEAIFAGAAARGLLPRAPRVVPITSLDYPTPARRPAYSRLDTTRLQSDFHIRLPHWTDA